MTTLERLHRYHIALRKNTKLKHLAPFLGMVISECERVGKDSDNRISTEDEVQRVLTKIAKSINESLAWATDPIQIISLNEERDYLGQFLPDLISEDILRSFVIEKCSDLHIGQAMGIIKKEFGNTVNMKLAAQLLKEI